MVMKKFGDLVEGDVILGADGQEVTVTSAYEQHIPKRMFEIELENGEKIKASGNHLWYVETQFDYQYHRERRKIGKAQLKKIWTKELEENLVAISESEDEIETSLHDLCNLLDDTQENKQVQYLLERIASSLGHVSENKISYQDMMTNEEINTAPSKNVRHYDARLFSQQILSLTGKRKYVKRYPLIAGNVVTTIDLLDMTDVNIPIIHSKYLENTVVD